MIGVKGNVLLVSGLLISFTPATQGQQKSVGVLPDYTIVRHIDELISSRLPSPMMDGNLGCAADGSLVVHSILEVDPSKPPGPNTEVVNVISPAAVVHTFDPTQVASFRQPVEVRGFDTGNREVDFLVNAAKASPPGEQSWAEPRGFHILKFDRQGDYRGESQLPAMSFNPQRIAAFDSGDFLIFGVDDMTREPKLARYSPIGGNFFIYHPEKNFAVSNSSFPLPFAEGYHPDKATIELQSLYSAVSFTEFTHYKDSLLLFQMSAGAPLFQVFDNGSIRVINLPVIEGFIADSVIPSDGLIYVRYQRTGTTSGKGDDGVILEISPSTGEALRRLHPADFTMWDVACVHAGKFFVAKMKGDYDFQFFAATAIAGIH